MYELKTQLDALDNYRAMNARKNSALLRKIISDKPGAVEIASDDENKLIAELDALHIKLIELEEEQLRLEMRIIGVRAQFWGQLLDCPKVSLTKAEHDN